MGSTEVPVCLLTKAITSTAEVRYELTVASAAPQSEHQQQGTSDTQGTIGRHWGDLVEDRLVTCEGNAGAQRWHWL